MTVALTTVPRTSSRSSAALEARRSRPDAEVRSGRPLRLHPDEPLDDRGRRKPLALEQQLARESRAVQLPQRERALGQPGSHPSRYGVAVRGGTVAYAT